MKLNEENVRHQLTHLYTAIESALARQHTTKKWSLTVLIAVLAGIFSGKIDGGLGRQMAMVFFLFCFFI